MKYTIIGHLLVSILAIGMALGILKILFYPSEAVSDAQEASQYVKPLTVKEIINKAKHAEVIAKLAKCESGMRPDIINWFDGGSPSRGLLQWKVSSFYYYNSKYELYPDLEEAEVMNIIMDPEAQVAMADRVLNEPNGILNWKNCARIMKII